MTPKDYVISQPAFGGSGLHCRPHPDRIELWRGAHRLTLTRDELTELVRIADQNRITPR